VRSDVTCEEEVAIYAYLRREEPKSADGMQDSMGANDICLGVAKFVPNLDQMGSADEWYEFSNGTGRIQVCYHIEFVPMGRHSLWSLRSAGAINLQARV
jgi:hypothetical protein